MREHGHAQGAHWLGRPAPAHIVDATKARFVLKHQPDGRTLPALTEVDERVGEFFFHPS